MNDGGLIPHGRCPTKTPLYFFYTRTHKHSLSPQYLAIMMESERDDSSRFDQDQATSAGNSSRQNMNKRRDVDNVDASPSSNPDRAVAADQTGVCCRHLGLFCFKAKERTKITALEYKLKNRQKKFGVDYLSLIERNASQQELKRCLRQAMDEIEQLQDEIEEHLLSIEGREGEIKEADELTMEETGGSGQSRRESGQPSVETTEQGSPKKKTSKKKDVERPTFTIDSDEEENCEPEQPKKIVKKKKKKKNQKSSST